MMKTILLLAFAIFIPGASVKEDKTLLRELFHKLNAALINLTEPERKEILLENLNMDGTCSEQKFCQAGLTEYDDFRTEAVSVAPVKQEKTSVKEEKALLRELVRKLDDALISLPVEPERKEILLEDLNIDGTCSEDTLCQAEQELKKKVSGLTKYEDFRTDGSLMRDLHMYNVHNGTTCSDNPVAKGSFPITLPEFLHELKKCVQNKASRASVKEEKALLGEVGRKLNAALINLPESKRKEILLENLNMDGTCSEDTLCQAEQELKKKVSGLPKYEDFRTDRLLMRYLHMYNVHHGTTCMDNPVAEGSILIALPEFLHDLRKCFQKAYRKV